jgi:ribosomal protein S18 acetylase RimI-like enzyme
MALTHFTRGSHSSYLWPGSHFHPWLSPALTHGAQIFMSVVDREFPQPGSADQYMDDLKKHLKSATAALKLHVRGGADGLRCAVGIMW